jgi:ppGpp synthetase/RelA/SpoT-type nucleotidyltranferase
MNIGYSKSFMQGISHKIHEGQILNEEEEDAFAAFRKAHAKILKNFRDRLSNKVSKNVAVGGRLKTRNTIIAKLQRRFCKMDLTRMQDIAGIRLVFDNNNALNNFRNSFINEPDYSNYERCSDTDKYNYIKTPNLDTGYRCIHDIYREKSNEPLKTHIEIQYRTTVQQAWASTLEIWDNAFNDETKFGLSSKKDLQTLLKYISELFARELENLSFLKDISDEELFKQIIRLDKSTGFIQNLETIKPKQKSSTQQLSFDYLIVKDTANSDELDVNIVQTQDAEAVFNKFKKIEDQIKQPDSNKTNENIVMLSVKKPDKNFEKLYNNYMNDFIKFRTFYEQSIQSLKKRLGKRAIIYALLLNPRYLQKRYSTSE